MLNALIAEDDDDIALTIAFVLRQTWPGCQVTVVSDGAAALAHVAASPVDLVILDVQMPPPDGFEVCRRIRAMSAAPILMLTVRAATLDKVQAFDLGADDYITKPFDPLELIARLRALLRRAQTPPMMAARVVSVGGVSLDAETHEVRVRGVLVRLTPTECRLLEELMRHPGDVLPHRQLLEKVWGAAYVGDPSYLKVFVGRLRQKLGDDPDQPRFIGTEWGVGYRFLIPRTT
jgi:two-component system KDP operon response regulator KdpE